MMSMYNVTLVGWDDGTFFPLHITAIVCISCGFIASIVVTVMSFKTHKKRFYSWSRSERFVVYLAICEMSFNFVHMFDHVTMVIEKDHVYPLELCQFYAFLIVLLLSIKNFILIVIALNAFLLIRFKCQMDFGSRDWRLFVYVMAFPIIVCTVAASLQTFGPAGAFCMVKPGLGTLLMTAIPFILILSVNTTLYSLTWFHIRRVAHQIRSVIGERAQSGTAYVKAAKTMTMFIAVFTVQWWAVSVYGIWQIITNDVPSIVYIFVVVFTNIGGCLNLIVFINIQKKRRRILALGSNANVQTSRPNDMIIFRVINPFSSDKVKVQTTTATTSETQQVDQQQST